MDSAAVVARGLHALERDAQRTALERYEDLRRDLSIALDDLGALGLARQAAAIFDGFGRALAGELGQLAAVVETRAIAWASAEVARLGGDARTAALLSAGARSVLRAAALELAGSWVAARRSQFVLEALASARLDPPLLRLLLLDRDLSKGRVSIWRSGVAPLHLDIWGLIWRLFNLLWSSIVGQAGQLGEHAGSPLPWRRVAVATLDAKTTECCRRIDGAVVGLYEPFRLTGTPRFADAMLGPPFHCYCRTVVRLRGEGEQ